jgi:transcriptional regulator with XRE-family HTH domain
MLPNRIRELRKQRGLTQKQVAELMGDDIRQPTVQRLESGAMTLTEYYIDRFAQALQVEPFEIFPQGEYVEWIPVKGRVELHRNKAVQFFGHENIYRVPFAKGQNLRGGRSALEIAELPNSFYIYQTHDFDVSDGGEFLVEDPAGNHAVRKLVTGSDGNRYLVSERGDPAILPLELSEASIIGRIVAEYVTK